MRVITFHTSNLMTFDTLKINDVRSAAISLHL